MCMKFVLHLFTVRVLRRHQHFNDSLERVLRELGLPKIRFHDLRHTAGSLLVSAGTCIEDVKGFLGYEDISITDRVYIHSNDVGQK